MTVRGVIWDLGGVLLRTERPEFRRRWEHRLGLSPGELHKLVFRSDASLRAELGQGTAAEVWQSVATRLNIDNTELAKLEQDFWAGDAIDQQLVNFIADLRPRLRTGLLSNAWREIRPKLTSRWPIANAFDEIVISAEIGATKPQPAAYQHALTRLELSPHQALFIDDAEVNVRAARQLGLQAVLFRDRAQCLKEVRAALAAGVNPDG